MCCLPFRAVPLDITRPVRGSAMDVAGNQYTLFRVKDGLVADRSRGPRQGVELLSNEVRAGVAYAC